MSRHGRMSRSSSTRVWTGTPPSGHPGQREQRSFLWLGRLTILASSKSPWELPYVRLFTILAVESLMASVSKPYRPEDLLAVAFLKTFLIFPLISIDFRKLDP